MESTNFYEKTGGLTLLVIKHNGNSFDYIRASGFGGKNMAYFPHWDDVRQFMYPGRCYVVVARVALNSSKASMKPIGVAFECSEAEAKDLSAEHYRQVNDGEWDAEEQYPLLFRDIELYRQEFIAAINKRMDEQKKKVQQHILTF